METLPTKQTTCNALSILCKSNPFEFSAPVRTIKDVLALPMEERPCLNAMKRADAKRYNGFIRLALLKLDADIKCKEKLTEGEIELIVDEIEAKYGCMLTFADIAVISRNAMTGKYGELYEKLTAAKVLRWIDEYADELQNTAYEQNVLRDKQQYGVQQKHYTFPVYEKPEQPKNKVQAKKDEMLAEILAKPETERTEIEKIYLQITNPNTETK